MRIAKFILKAFGVLAIALALTVLWLFADLTKPLMNQGTATYTVTLADGTTRTDTVKIRTSQTNFADGGSCAEPFFGVLTFTMPLPSTPPRISATVSVNPPDFAPISLGSFSIQDAGAEVEIFENIGSTTDATGDINITRGWLRWRFDGTVSQTLRIGREDAQITLTFDGAAQATWRDSGIVTFPGFCGMRGR